VDNLIYKDPKEIGDFSPEAEAALRIVQEELKSWESHDLDRLLTVMDENIIYHDVTLPPAKGHAGLRAFGEGWLAAAPDFAVPVEKFIVQGNTVVTMGRITGTITAEFFGQPAPNKAFDCMYAQVAVVRNGKIVYVRDHWDSATMMRQMGWLQDQPEDAS